ncbi:hypothetical protein ACFX13_006247 [Malus domestica]
MLDDYEVVRQGRRREGAKVRRRRGSKLLLRLMCKGTKEKRDDEITRWLSSSFRIGGSRYDLLARDSVEAKEENIGNIENIGSPKTRKYR